MQNEIMAKNSNKQSNTRCLDGCGAGRAIVNKVFGLERCVNSDVNKGTIDGGVFVSQQWAGEIGDSGSVSQCQTAMGNINKKVS